MATYLVVGHITISVNTEVEAASEAAAREAAMERGVMSLCHQCANGEAGREWVTSGELDGEVTEIVEVTELEP